MTIDMNPVMEVMHRYVPKGFAPKAAIVLGSGLSLLSEQLINPVSIPFQAIPGVRAGTVAGHASLLMMGYLNEVPVVCLRGRLHRYEGDVYDSLHIFMQMIRRLGATTVLLTGAVGSLRPEVPAGELVMVTDHINFQFNNPLVGHNDDTIGPRFVSLEEAYHLGLQDIMEKSAKKMGLTLHKGVYLCTLGPSFETPAEIRAFKQWGADVVGMAVVPEVIIARKNGLKVACVTAVTNLAVGLSDVTVTHDVTLQQGELGARKLIKLIPEFLSEMNKVY